LFYLSSTLFESLTLYLLQNFSYIMKVGSLAPLLLNVLTRISIEEFHSTPETQTDEAYNHPEDLEHFAHHEGIERREAEKEALYQGITVEEVLKLREEYDHKAPAPPGQPAPAAPAAPADEKVVQQPVAVPHPHDDHVPQDPPIEPSPPNPKHTRTPPPEKQDPHVKYSEAAGGKRQSEWGAGEQGYKSPKSAGDKMRKNLPYKVGNPFFLSVQWTKVS
jgi:hypothetical protein